MKKNKIFLLGIIAIITTIAIVPFYNIKEKTKYIDNKAINRNIDLENNIFYFDDEAIALIGEIPSTENINSVINSTYNLINEKRAAAGLSTLIWNEDLATAARIRAQEIVNIFSHTRPNGTDWYTVNSSVMYGENLAKFYYTSDSVVTAWMASPTHAANIMDINFKTIGIGIFQSSDGKWYWAQEFGY